MVEGEPKIVRGKSNLPLQVREPQLMAPFSGLTVSVEGGGDGIDTLLAAINEQEQSIQEPLQDTLGEAMSQTEPTLSGVAQSSNSQSDSQSSNSDIGPCQYVENHEPIFVPDQTGKSKS